MNQQLIQQFRSAWSDTELVVLEVFHAIKHALRFGGEVLTIAAIEPDRVLKLADDLAPDVAERLTARLMVVEMPVFKQLSLLPHATGIIAIARRPPYSLESALGDPRKAPIVLLEDPRNLGNLGAAVRVAAAAGAAGLVALGTEDPWSSQAVRGAAGLQFALPVVRAESLPDLDRPLIAVHPEGPNMELAGIPKQAILAFGTERRGLSKTLLDRADYRVAIPMEAGVSSLNLATAVAVVLYAAKLK